MILFLAIQGHESEDKHVLICERASRVTNDYHR
jgi:hypothetical protein